jgi:hypothetical protein
MLTWINDRRTAVLSAVAALVSVVLAARQADTVPGVDEYLVAVGAGLAAYVAAYQAIGLTEKLAIGAVIAGLGAVAAGVLAGTAPTDIALSTLLVILGHFGVGAALPSTAGSVALRSAEYTRA